MPATPTPPLPPLPGALAQQRLALDTLLMTRVRAMLAQADPIKGLPTDDERSNVSDEAAIVDAQVRHFAEQVDRDNDLRQRLAGAGHPPLDYEQAVLIEGSSVVVVALTDYLATPAFWQASAGGHLDTLMLGRDLFAFLRQGDDDDEAAVAAGAEQLGLGT